MCTSVGNAKRDVNRRQRRSVTNDHRRNSVAFGLKISKSGGLYILITLLLGFAAVNTGNNLLFLVVSGLLAFMSVTGLAGMSNIKRLIPDLLPSDEVYAGIPVSFDLSVRNISCYLPSFLIHLTYVDSQPVLLPVVTKSSVKHVSVQAVFSKRGLLPLGRVTISSPYPVGFFVRYWTFELDRLVTVFPHPLASSCVNGGDDSNSSGLTMRPERGHSGDVERIYPYTGSEPLRLIHWKHSARSEELHVKEFGRHATTPVEIDLDMVGGCDVEERLSRATWLVQRWLPVRPVGLKLGAVTIPAGSGRQHGLKLLKELALYDSH